MMRSVRYCILTALLLEATCGLNAQADDCDFNCGTFTEKTPISYEVLKASLAIFNGKIYAVGAVDFLHTDYSMVIYHDTMYVYDPETDTWDKNRAPIPEARFSPASNMVIDGKWYFPGGTVYLPGEVPGNYYFVPVSRHDMYDPEKDRWELRASLPYAISGQGAVFNEKIYLVGGWKDDISAHGAVYVYDPGKDLWTQKSDMNVPRRDHYVAVAGGKIYAIGGNRDIIDLPESMNLNAEVYDPETDQWRFISDPPDSMGIELAGYAVVEDEIYVLGGFVSVGDYIPTRNMFKYVPESDQWIFIGKLPEDLVHPGCIAIGRSVFLLGGWKPPRLPNDKPTRELIELKLGDITLDSLPRMQQIVQGTTETIDLAAYFRHVLGKPMSYRICMDPAYDDEIAAVIEGDLLKLTATSAGFAKLRVLAEEGIHRMGFDLELDVVTGTGPMFAAWDPELHVYPNPSKGSATIAFDLPRPDRVRVAVLDVTGKKITTLIDENRLPGKQQVAWNTSGIQKGIYICSVTASGNRTFTKIIVE